MRKIWSSEDNCIKQVRISHSSPSKCEFRTTAQASANFAQQPKHVRISHNQPCMCEFHTSPCVFGENSPLFCRLHMRSFLMYFLCKFLSYPCNQPITSFAFVKTIRGVKIISRKTTNGLYFFHLVKFSSQGEIQSSLCFPFLSSIFFFLEAKQPLRMFSQRMRG